MHQQTNEREVLTLREAAAYLKVSERTLWNLAKDGVIPSFRVGAQYRFLLDTVRVWAGGGQEASQAKEES